MHDYHEVIMEEIRTKKIISDELSAKLEEIVSDYAGVFRRLNNEA
jgi:ribosome-binding protein aMBF1 (putative translation factor)